MKTICITVLVFSRWVIFSSSIGRGNEEWVAPAFADTLKNPFTADGKIIAEGKKIYESVCWSCHGLDGKGEGPASKELKPKPADHTSDKVQKQSDGAIFWKMSKGRGEMLPLEKSLSKQQRWKLVCYIRELGKKEGTQ
ncbi:MAG TPA: cytochrome c [Bacteroidia bacterium]|nr:cytochrome c [Bacteroidia bacterium]